MPVFVGARAHTYVFHSASGMIQDGYFSWGLWGYACSSFRDLESANMLVSYSYSKWPHGILRMPYMMAFASLGGEMRTEEFE